MRVFFFQIVGYLALQSSRVGPKSAPSKHVAYRRLRSENHAHHRRLPGQQDVLSSSWQFDNTVFRGQFLKRLIWRRSLPYQNWIITNSLNFLYSKYEEKKKIIINYLAIFCQFNILGEDVVYFFFIFFAQVGAWSHYGQYKMFLFNIEYLIWYEWVLLWKSSCPNFGKCVKGKVLRNCGSCYPVWQHCTETSSWQFMKYWNTSLWQEGNKIHHYIGESTEVYPSNHLMGK